jgi:histidine triad (HIT) family protein
MHCQFCELANGRGSAHVIYQTKNICCFLDIDPINNGHTLIVPKKHVLDTEELNQQIRLEVMDAVVLLSKTIKACYRPDGISVMQNGGYFNDVNHYHMHVFPRYKNDGFSWIDRTSLVKNKNLAEEADALRKLINLNIAN